MASTYKQPQLAPSPQHQIPITFYKAVKNPTANSSPTPTPNSSTPNPTMPSPSPQDLYLSNSTHLTRQEILRRRFHHLKTLSICYRGHYWSLMEHVRSRFRQYFWKYGLSPYQTKKSGLERDIQVGIEGSGENEENLRGERFGLGGSIGDGDYKQCGNTGCKFKAMSLSNFCQLHILSDANQKLYKPCNYVIKSAQAGPIICGKPILKSSVPSLCTLHFQKAQQHVTRALKKAGLNVSSSSKVAPKFHIIVTEYIRQIQSKRRSAQMAYGDKLLGKQTIER